MKRALFVTTVVIALLAAAALLLTACGGSDDSPEGPDVPTPKVDCKPKPDLCK
ncbi:MAG: hypothetical protein IV107_23975 [Paucibacter sp.]|nr:hypothetical protein [Roseateles sp.]